MATVPMYDTGICQVMIRFHNRMNAPISKRSADVSPIHPPMFPIKRDLIIALENKKSYKGWAESDSSCNTFGPSFNAPSGVAPLMLSISCCGIEESNTGFCEITNPHGNLCNNVVISTGHDASKNALPASAGLKIL